jgi:hypothetical protein
MQEVIELKEENGHTHHHEHDHDKNDDGYHPEQIKALIPYLIKHNLDHIEDLRKWHKLAMASGFNDVANEFRKVIKLSEKIDRHFMSALGKMENHG